MIFPDFSENLVAFSFVFLNVVTPVFILVVVGYFVGPLLKIEARPLSKTAYFFLFQHLFLILSVRQR